METFYAQAIAVLLGLIIGLWLRRLVWSLIALISMAGISTLIVIATGHTGMLEANRDLVPQAMSASSQLITAIKQVLIGTPGALVGILLGVVTRELLALAKS